MEKMDLFDREQKIHTAALERYKELQEGATLSPDEYGKLAKEYGRLLKQLRRFTKMSDKTAVDLNNHKQELLDKVHFDSLTGIYNRRYMEENLKRVISSLSRSEGAISLFMIDIDFFKKYNDTYGHSRGDSCLKEVAVALRDSTARANDFVARYGGEEFAAILPNTDRRGAIILAERMLCAVRSLNIPHEKNDAASCVTVSIGVTTGIVRPGHKGLDYIEMADKALYTSKHEGRNRYTFISFEEGDGEC